MNGTTPPPQPCQACSPPLECKTLQIIEPDSTLVVGTITPGHDPSLDEAGNELLFQGQVEVDITFLTPKAGDYRFEYLYIDAFGVQNPANIDPVVQNQTAFGATINLAGTPILDGYILRWHVVVISLTTPGGLPPPDSPESVYQQLVQGSNVATVFFHVARSTQAYGFSELRVENLIDLPGQQTPIQPQVIFKDFTSFKVGLYPTPPNNNYYLVARTP